MARDKGGYGYKLTIIFYWATDVRPNGNESIGPIEAKNEAG
jgi:hypothetical protein